MADEPTGWEAEFSTLEMLGVHKDGPARPRSSPGECSPGPELAPAGPDVSGIRWRGPALPSLSLSGRGLG